MEAAVCLAYAMLSLNEPVPGFDVMARIRHIPALIASHNTMKGEQP